jgi:hypothetical protein
VLGRGVGISAMDQFTPLKVWIFQFIFWIVIFQLIV